MPALAGVLPLALLFQESDQILGPAGQTQLEQIVSAPRFGLCQHTFLAEGAIAPQQGGLGAGWQRVQQPPQSGQGVQGGGLFAGLHLHVQDQPGRAHQVGVIDMRGPTALVGVVADFSALLMAVDGFDGRVDVQNPGHAQERGVAFLQVPLLPAGHGDFGFRLPVAFG